MHASAHCDPQYIVAKAHPTPSWDAVGQWNQRSILPRLEAHVCFTPHPLHDPVLADVAESGDYQRSSDS